jgi:uncharacterized LabA/DUF88 family protein
MSKRIGVFIDTGNIYSRVNYKFQGRKLDYKKYLEFFEGLGTVSKAVAYGVQLNDDAHDFIQALRYVGFSPRFKSVKHQALIPKRNNHNVGLTIDVVNMLDRFDMVVIGSSNAELIPTIRYCMDKGVDVIVFACSVPKVLRDICTRHIEVYEGLLEDATPKTTKREA